MDKLKQWVALTALAGLALAAGGWFLVISPKRAEATDLRAVAEQDESANAQLRNDLALLKSRSADLPKEQAKLAAVAAKIPPTPALPSLIRALTAAADSSNVELLSITPEAPAPVVTPVSNVAQQTPTSGDAPSAEEDSASTATPRARTTSSAAGLLNGIPISVVIVGGYFEAERFTAELEKLPRAFRVTALSLNPSDNPVDPDSTPGSTEDGSTLTTTIKGLIYMAAQEPTAIATTAKATTAKTATAKAGAAAGTTAAATTTSPTGETR